MAQRYFTNSAPGTPEHKRVGFAPRELPAEAEQRLEELRNSIQGLGFWNLHGDQLPVEAEVFTLAWACWRQGHPALAQRLYREAEHLPRSYGAPRPPRTWPVREEMGFGPEPSARVAAAFALRPHDRPAAIKTMIAEWRSLASDPQDPNNLDSGEEGAIQFLASCDSPEAIAALLQDLSKYSVGQRLVS